MHLVNISNDYCNARGLKNCERYHLCMYNSYDKVKNTSSTDVSLTLPYIMMYSPVKYEGKEYAHLMDNTYELLNVDFRNLNKPNITRNVAYFLYAHNSCASITGDKTYNIDSYMPLLEEELGVK
jgi:hypothetical protein